ncbi:MAG TPA: DUF2283 domain-containing protein [Verrucomicrobiae bacterium]|nr:DUF2283 domain-containing protein [Verrucomicrobiae bacterium]
MKVTYDADVDAMHILFSNAAIKESDEAKPGIILEFDKDGNVVGIEILDASKIIGEPAAIEFAAESGQSLANTLREKRGKYGK